MVYICLCLAWLLVNTWATLIISVAYKYKIEEWRDILDIIILAIISPLWIIILRYITKLILFFRKRS